MANDKISMLSGNKIELHYWFSDNSHLMDAYIQNKCEYEFLGIAKEIANTFKVEITIETEPLAEGGLRRWFKIATKEENKKATITIAIVTTLFATIIVTPISTSLTKITEKVIENIFEDPEIKELEKEKLRLEVEKLRQETSANANNLDTNHVIKKKKSNFYEALDSYQKVDKVTFSVEDTSKNKVIEAKTVLRKDFKGFILVSDELDPIEQDDVVIEIVSPVLKKGNYRWIGVYKGETVSFSMKSNEFKTLVQTGQVQFKNGTSISCQVTVKRKIDNEGLIKIISIEVNRVNSYFENEKSIETPEGKKHRREKEADKAQLKLFAKREDEDDEYE